MCETDVEREVDDETGMNGFSLIEFVLYDDAGKLVSILLSLISGLYMESTSCNFKKILILS